MASPPLRPIHDFLYALALRAGDMITTAAADSSPTTISTKKNSSDLVTETDRAVESMIATALKSEYPDYAFLGEETAPPSGHVPRGPVFIVDPIDGTTNFVHSHPYISISLCFALDRIPQIGIVYNPFTQHLYHAIREQGSFLTCPSIPTSRPPMPGAAGEERGGKVEAEYITRQLPLKIGVPLEDLDTALLAIEWGNERGPGGNFDVKTRAFRALAAAPDVEIPAAGAAAAASGPGARSGTKGKMVHSFRSLGSAALNCCSVARGDLDAYWEGGCWAWDVGAGWVVVEEAGGMVVGGNQGEWECEVDGRRYLVVRGGGRGSQEQRRLVEGVWEAVGGGGELVY